MKIIVIVFLLIICSTTIINAQSTKSKEIIDAEIKSMAITFLDCIIKKDSIKFFSLFNENPITFVQMAVNTPKENPNNPDYKIENDYVNVDYKDFYRSFSDQGYTAVKYDKLTIEHVDYMASLIFEYTFLRKGKKKCHVNQSVGLIYKNASWWITRVIYTIEVESR